MEHHLMHVADRKMERWMATELLHQQFEGLFALAKMHPEAAFLLPSHAYSEVLEVFAECRFFVRGVQAKYTSVR